MIALTQERLGFAARTRDHLADNRRQWQHLRPALALGGMCLLSGSVVGSHGVTVMVAIFLSSLVSSIAGFAFSAICGAILFHLGDDPVRVVEIMITCSIANQAAMTWAARRDIEWRALRVFLAGGVLGLVPGVWILLYTDHALYSDAIGIFLMFYGIYMLLRKPLIVRRQHAAIDFASGVLGGITGGAGAMPSVPVTIWCSMKGWDKSRQRAIYQPFILIMQLVALLAICLARTADTSYDFHDLLFLPASLFGTLIGLALYKSLSAGQFARAVNLLLIVSGLSYVL